MKPFKIGDQITHTPVTETKPRTQIVNGTGRKDSKEIVFFRSGSWDYARNCKPKAKAEEVKVIFRTWKSKDGGGVFALFLLEPYGSPGWLCMSYAHVGQHGGACPHICTDSSTRLATPKEYRALAQELRRIGYRLRIITRVPRNAFDVRKSKLLTK